MGGIAIPMGEPRRTDVWQRAALSRAKQLTDETNRSARARLVLAELLARAGEPVGLVVVHSWSRRTQGAAYLWATRRLLGLEDEPPPWRE